MSTTNHIKLITLMKDTGGNQCFRKTETMRWMKCSVHFQKQMVVGQQRLIAFMHKYKHLLDQDPVFDEPHIETDPTDDDEVEILVP